MSAASAAEHLGDPPTERREATFLIAGLDCRGCARHAERALTRIEGVRTAEVRFISEMAHVAYDVRRTSEREIAAAMRRAGHRLSRVDGPAPSSRNGLGPLRIAGTLIACFELAALALATAQEPAPPGLGVARLVLASIAIALGGGGLGLRAWRLLREGVVGREALVVVAALVSFALGCLAMRGAASPFAEWHGFEAAAGIVASALMVRAVYSKLWGRALADLAASERARGGLARRIDGAGREETTSREALAIGDRVRVLEGELVPADLRLDAPALLADPSAVGVAATMRQAGDLAPSGALLLSASASGRIARQFRDGIGATLDAEIHRVVARVERELGGWSSGDGWGDLSAQALFAGAFTFSVFALAAHLALGGASAGPGAWSSAVAVLVVASPAAFVLAAPLARAIALLRARSAAIVVREPRALDLLARSSTACFEKTGTVTTGELEVSALIWQATASPDRLLLEDVLALELGASHAAGRAIASYLRARGIRPSALAHGARIVETAGGASGRVRDALIEIAAARRFPGARAEEAPPAASLAWFARNGVPMGYFILTDPLRADADAALRALWRRGMPCRLVSGDRAEAAEAAGHRLGVPATGGLSPLDKALAVRDLQHSGARVLYVRDAVETASSGHADVSIAVAQGALPHTVGAPIVVTDGRLDRLPWLVDLARAARRRRIECSALAVAYNVVVVPLAAIGHVTPLLAAGLALAESLLVLANAARLLRYPRAPRVG